MEWGLGMMEWSLGMMEWNKDSLIPGCWNPSGWGEWRGRRGRGEGWKGKEGRQQGGGMQMSLCLIYISIVNLWPVYCGIGISPRMLSCDELTWSLCGRVGCPACKCPPWHPALGQNVLHSRIQRPQNVPILQCMWTLYTLAGMSVLNKHALSILKIVKEENIIEETLWQGIADIDIVVKYPTSLRRYSMGTK